MKIKTKLNLGIGLLFTLIVLLATVTIMQINSLAEASNNILKDNKETISYTRIMLKSLSEIDNENALDTFEYYLSKQRLNITETGEKQLTDKLALNFNTLKKNVNNKEALVNSQLCLFEIMNINLSAIDYKNTIATKTAKKSILLISIISFFCFGIALVLFLKLPSNISNPIKELIDSIKSIASNDYSKRVNFEENSDFGELAVAFNTMANKLEEYNKTSIAKLLTEKKITETLINKVQYPIISLDKDLKVNLINEEFLSLLEKDKKDIIGKNILSLEIDNELIRQLIVLNPDNDANFSNEENSSKIHIEKNGKDIYFEKVIQDITFNQSDQVKRLMGYVIILKNITKFVDLDLAKTKFIATISHELKTPISAIKFSLQLLENEKTGSLNNEQKELIKSCEEDTNILLGIISELLNITQIETGNIQLNIMPSSIKDILYYAIITSQPLADKKNISLIIDCPENLPTVLADKDKTAWVLTNIIFNAIHYSNKNAQINISVADSIKTQFLSICDNGPGIDSLYKDKIFDRYFRIPGTHKSGTGLGLAISKEFIEAQGGQIKVESELGKGSKFTITFNKPI